MKKRGISFISVCLFLMVCGGLLIFIKTRPQVGTDPIEFQTKYPAYIVADIPENAKEFRSVSKTGLVMKYFLYSFTLNKDAYHTYKEDVLEYYSVDLQDEKQLQYGYAHWYGMKVSDVNGDMPNYPLDDFPFGLPFDKIIEDNINDYTILLCSPRGTGSKCYGVLVDDEKCQIVGFYSDQIR